MRNEATKRLEQLKANTVNGLNRQVMAVEDELASIRDRVTHDVEKSREEISKSI